ncbi:MAG TPA: prolyl oligopeptidase family serine peptidase [Flavobacterium sp.]
MKAYLIIMFFAVVGCHSASSQQKRYLTPEEFKLWNHISDAHLSPDAKWASYAIRSESHIDTLFIHNIASSWDYMCPNAYDPVFSPDSKIVAFMRSDSLVLLDLTEATKKTMPAKAAVPVANGKYLLVETHDRTMRIVGFGGDVLVSIEKTAAHLQDPLQSVLAVITEAGAENKVLLMSLKGAFAQKVLARGSTAFAGLEWDKKGAALAFFEALPSVPKGVQQNRVHLVRLSGKKQRHVVLDPHKDAFFPSGQFVPVSRLVLSPGGEHVFFDIIPLAVPGPKPEPDVVLWHHNAKRLPQPDPATQWSPELGQFSVWLPDKGKLRVLQDADFPNVAVTGDARHVLMYTMDKYLPTYKYGGEYFDLYIMDVSTGKKQLLVEKQYNEIHQVQVSPGGKYVTYFKDSKWYVYDIKKASTACVTTGLEMPFYDEMYDFAGVVPSFGSPGWTADDQHLILYDRYDIWLMAPDGSSWQRITKGRENHLSYRLQEYYFAYLPRTIDFTFAAREYDVSAGLLLSFTEENTLGNGYALWNAKTGVRQLLDRNMQLEWNDTRNNVLLYRESNFSTPPRLMVLASGAAPVEIAQSNVQQSKYHWGRSELVEYTTAEGRKLKGALFYPAGYEEGRKYPVIVNIYQRKSGELHYYEAPSLQSPNGTNTTTFMLDGYFVFKPDIVYRLNAPAVSALECVVAAVQKIMENPAIDKDNIGLIGHSYGGFETSFLIGHTNIFKAAVAGAPATDLFDYYLSIDGYNKANMYRFEEQQFRLQLPFYKEEFLENSPIRFLQHINTPVLLWTGDKDDMVSWTHTLKMHIGLWRLGKVAPMLVYPGEHHVLSKPENQLDLNLRIREWFGYYLKGAVPADWVKDKKQ